MIVFPKAEQGMGGPGFCIVQMPRTLLAPLLLMPCFR